MKRIFILMLAYMSVVAVFAQKQTGVVRESSNTSTEFTPIAEVTIKVKGYSNPTMTDKKGRFSVKLDVKKNGQGFKYLSIYKKGYELTDPNVIGREYAYSSKVEQEITMVSQKKLNAEKARIERTVTVKVEAQYKNVLDALNDSLAQCKMTMAAFVEAQKLAQRQFDAFEPLIAAMADHYARTDASKMDSLDREINRCIMDGDIAQADLLLAEKGNLDARIESLERQIAIYGQADSLIKKLDKALQERKAAYLRERDDIANDLYNKYAISLSRFDAKKAGEYILLRAELDITNIDYQLDAGAFACEYLADYTKAETLYNRAIAESVKQYGLESEMTAMCKNHLGGLYLEESKYKESVECRTEALKIRESIYGENSACVAACYNNLANIYYGMEDFDKALVCAKHSVEIYGRIVEKNVLDEADSYNTLAGVFIAQGDLEQSLFYYEKAVALADSLLGEDNIHSATSLNGIAVIKDYTGKTKEAIGYYLRTLDIFKKIYGEKHPNVATVYSNLGMSYQDIQQYDSAMICHNKALEMRLDLLGELHDDVATSLNNMGSLCSSMKQYDVAINFYGKALTILENVLGTDNVHFAKTLANVGVVFYRKGDIENSLLYMNEALSVYNKNPEAYRRELKSTVNSVINICESFMKRSDCCNEMKDDLSDKVNEYRTKYNNYLK